MSRHKIGNCTLLCLCLAAAAIAIPPAADETQVTFYVATNGNNSWSGKLEAPNAGRTDGPFLTLSRARDAVREMKGRQTHNGLIRVMVRGGNYYTNETLMLEREDGGSREAPITYTAYPGERPVLSGGQKVTGWKPYKGQILQADLRGARGGAWKFRQLFLNGARQIRARYPNFDPHSPLYGGWTFIEGPARKGSGNSFIYKAATFTNHWASPTDGEVVIFEAGGWVNDIIPIKSVEEGRRLITLTRSVLNPDRTPWFAPSSLAAGDRFRVENLLEELDQPGEWCLDSNGGVLYFWPPDGALKSTDTIVVPALHTLIDLHNTSWLVISGFTFTQRMGGDALHHADVDGYGPMYPEEGTEYVGDTLHLKGAEHCVIENNHFDAVGGNAIYLEGYNLRNSIRRNEISYVGANGISLLGSYVPVDGVAAPLQNGRQRMPMFNEVTDNYIHHCGVFNKYVAGVFLGVSDGNLIAHNRIEYMPHHAINLGLNGFGRNVVEYNEIHHVTLEISDTGAINSWMDFEKSDERAGHIIRFNLISDVPGCHTTKEGQIITPDGTANGIYLDNDSSNSLIHGNIVIRTSAAGIFLHGGKNNLVENNVVVDSGRTTPANAPSNYPSGQMCYMPYLKGAFFTGNRFSRNIVYYHQGSVPVVLFSVWSAGPGSRPGQTGQEQSLAVGQSDNNILFRPDGKEPRILISTDVNEKPSTRELALSEWRSLGFDTGSLTSDPLFVDPDHDNYRLKPDSPAMRLGFAPIAVENIGIRH